MRWRNTGEVRYDLRTATSECCSPGAGNTLRYRTHKITWRAVFVVRCDLWHWDWRLDPLVNTHAQWHMKNMLAGNKYSLPFFIGRQHEYTWFGGSSATRNETGGGGGVADGARRVDRSSVSIIPKSKRKGIRCKWEQKSRPYHVVQLQKSSALSVESQGKDYIRTMCGLLCCRTLTSSKQVLRGNGCSLNPRLILMSDIWNAGILDSALCLND